MIGGAYYIRDLNPRKQFNLTQPAAGVFYRFTPNYRYAFRGGINWGKIMGDDSQSDDADQLQRNLNFKSQIIEFNAIAEFNFLEYRISNDKYKFTTFLFLGIDVFTHKPLANMGNYWIELQPQKTEGQSKGYKLTQVAIPFGIGAKMNVSKKVGIGLEWGPRKTFTDYLDDVSGDYPSDPSESGDPSLSLRTGELGPPSSAEQRNVFVSHDWGMKRGDKTHKDGYMTMSLSYSYVLRGKSSFYRGRYGHFFGKHRRGKVRKIRAKF